MRLLPPAHTALLLHGHLALYSAWLLLATCAPRAWYMQHRSITVAGVFSAHALLTVLEWAWSLWGFTRQAASVSQRAGKLPTGAAVIVHRLNVIWQGPVMRLQGRLALEWVSSLICQAGLCKHATKSRKHAMKPVRRAQHTT